MFTTYILKSEKDGRFYIGSTGNISERIIRHNKGYSKYTKGKGPYKLIYKEDYNTLAEAKKREYYLKSLKSKVAIEKIVNRAAFV
ncbi:GIY-YIG nuclease family protein [Candidatus Parcubacteria bacterium]|nr:MAG: GIY-YIG nuclease family protein [Candidatus Parcubacteria bacterium]